MPPKANTKSPAQSNKGSTAVVGEDENIVAPELPATAIATANGSEGNLAKLGASVMARFMAEKGIKVVHIGGSLPLMDFDAKKDKGKAILIRFLSCAKPTDESEFALVAFDVLDPERFPNDPSKTTDVDACVVQKAQLVASHALHEWAGSVNKGLPGKPFTPGTALRGDIVILTYGGDTQTGRGMNPLKLFEIAGVYCPRPAAK